MDVLADLLGQAQSIVRLREQIRQIFERTARSRRLPPILLQGETGTGKNLVAGVIHREGPRSAGPFVDVNCAAIPEGLLEAELFGFERGAFTDARQAKAGLFQTASGGTLFLDEIALLSDALQAKLLKVIDERTVRRLGGTRSEPVDVSIIAATNEDLLTAVDAHRFRPDLYHRLAVLTLRLPPLRERRDDIPLLADHFLGRACRDYGLPPKMLAPAAREALRGYDWPGNVRDLSNLMERVALLMEASCILPEMLGLPSGPTGSSTAAASAPPGSSLDARVETWERQELLGALDATRWNVARAAGRLGITRGTIRYRIDKYGLAPPKRGSRRRRSVPAPSPSPSAPPVLAAPPTTRWERRLVALLEATIHPLDADDSAGELGRDLVSLVDKIEGFAGRVEDAGPGRLVAAFGVDPAEDAPRRAALAAMAMQRALARGRRSPARGPAVTIAIHAEACDVGEVGGRLQIDADAKRRMTRVLEELGARADPDSVLVSEAARSLLGPRFDVVARSGAAGRGARLRAYHQDRFGLGGQPGPFVGREPELALLLARWQEALGGRGQVMAVVGEPGIGKSRLLFEFRRALGDEAASHLEGRGASYGGGTPYLPVVELLRRYFDVDERDDPRTTGDKVTARLLALDRGLAPDVSAILALLDAPVDDPQWETADPSQRRQRTLDAVTRLVLRQSQERPVILVIEDLHWIDAETEALLDRLAAGLPAARLLLLVSYRPEYRHRVRSQTSYTQVHLDPLAPASAQALLRALVGDHAACEPLTRLLLERTEGNPFFLEESVRTLIETRALVGARGAYRPAHDVPVLEVPSTVRAVLATRVDRLSAEDRPILEAAAVVGKDVSFTLLQSVAGASDAVLRRAVSGLQAAEFLLETRLVPDLEYTFRHALTHEVAYAAVPPDRRRTLHARMVETLERLHADRLTEHVERLSRHALAAELWPKALAYCDQAGAKAASRSAHHEATRYFEQALGVTRRLEDTRVLRETTLDLHFRLRWSLVALGEYAKLADSLRAAASLAEALDDRHRLGEISQTTTHFLRVMGDCGGALDAGRRARAIGATLGDRALEIRATYQLAMVHRQVGDHEAAIDAFRAVADFIGNDLIRERFGEPSVLSVHARSWQATVLAEVGRFGGAITVGEEALRIAEEADNAYSLTNAHICLGLVHLRRGALDAARRLLERAVGLCREGDFLVLLSHSTSALGAVLALSGHVDEALPLLAGAAEAAAAKRVMASYALYLARLGRAKFLAGQTKEASELGLRACEVARTYGERGHEAWALHLLGECAAVGDSPDPVAAEDHQMRAMALARSLGMQPLVALCHASLGALYRRGGDADRARAHLITARTMLQAMEMRPWLAGVEADMDALGVAR